MIRASLLGCALACCGLVGCDAIIGLADIPPVSSGEDASIDQASGDDSTGSDTSADDASGGGQGDGGVDAPGDGASESSADGGSEAAAEACASTHEICTDGIDNDCNGLVDCADPACAQLGYACVPDVPSGWTYAAIDRSNVAACPAGTTPQELVAAASGAAAMCGCSCTVAQLPSCTGGQMVGALGSTPSCGDGTYVFKTGGCTPASLQTASWLEADPLPPSGGACGANPSKSVPAPQETDWRACGTQGPFGKGCAQGQVCAVSGGSFAACVTQPTSASCPASYPHAQSVGTGVSDTRDCTSCTCGSSVASASCTPASLSFYTDGVCGALGTSVAVNGGCNSMVGNLGYGSYLYTATPSATCAAPTQMPQPTGGVAVTGTVTTCCVQ